MPTGFFLVSVVGSPLENTCPSCRTYIERNVPSFSRVLAFLAGHEECQLWSCPVSHSGIPGGAEGGKEEEKKEKGLRVYIYIYIHPRVMIEDRVGKAGSCTLASQMQDERKLREREKKGRGRERRRRVVKRSKEIRAGTEKGEKKKGEGATR